jgi:hypothetical protein
MITLLVPAGPTITSAALASVLPAPPPETPPALVEFVDLWFELGQWIIGAAAALCVLICAVMLIVGRKQRSATAYQGLEGIAWIIGGVGLAGFGPVLVLAFLR